MQIRLDENYYLDSIKNVPVIPTALIPLPNNFLDREKVALLI